MTATKRSAWTTLSDERLMAQVEVDTYRASGPGGQKRNKTSSAVRMRHLPTGLIVIAEESRSQHDNRARAFLRLRQAFFLKLRDELTPEELTAGALARHPDYQDARTAAGRLDLGRKDPRFWPAAGLVLDVLQALEARVSEAAEVLGISTANLIQFLAVETKVWEEANHLRTQFGHKALRNQ
jgi:hypothetical protein